MKIRWTFITYSTAAIETKMTFTKGKKIGAQHLIMLHSDCIDASLSQLLESCIALTSDSCVVVMPYFICPC